MLDLFKFITTNLGSGHTDNMLNKLEWEPLKQHKAKARVYMLYKIHSNLVSIYLNSISPMMSLEQEEITSLKQFSQTRTSTNTHAILAQWLSGTLFPLQ